MGRKDRNSDAPAAENMLPKLLDVPISTYLMVLAKIRRPSATPSARTSRSFSSRMTSAASLATSVAESTEIPTSAACSARASLTPSPRNATLRPVRRWTRTMRALCSGLTRAKTVVVGIAAASWSSSRASRSVPVSAPPWSSPSSRQTLTATAGLSPVTTLTAMPRPASRRSAAAASASAGRGRPASPAGAGRVRRRRWAALRVRGGRVATATTRLPAANSASRALRARRRGRRRTGPGRSPGAPLVTR